MREFLVIQAARFGDLLQTARLIFSLMQRGRVHIALAKELAPLAALIYPEADIYALNFHERPSYEGLKANEAVFVELAARAFDQVYDCNFSGMTMAISRLFADDKLRGYRPGHDSCGGSYRSPWVRLAFKASEMRQASPVNLVDFWGHFTDLPMAPESVNPVAQAGGKGIGVAVAGREQRRSLPTPVLAEIIQIVSRITKPAEIRLFGAETEKQASRQLWRSLPPALQNITRDLCGKTDWQALVNEIKGLDLLLSPDTGLMHLGAALGTPVMAFFLSSAWCHETGPYGEGHIIFQSVMRCSPCLETAQCPRSWACLEAYKSREFSRALVQLLSGAKQIAPPPNLQIWKTAFDNLGAKPELLAGEDVDSFKRACARLALKEKLGLKTGAIPLADPEYLRIMGHFTPDSEWMLPPWRYS